MPSADDVHPTARGYFASGGPAQQGSVPVSGDDCFGGRHTLAYTALSSRDRVVSVGAPLSSEAGAQAPFVDAPASSTKAEVCEMGVALT
jgi:hypothetical protein